MAREPHDEPLPQRLVPIYKRLLYDLIYCGSDKSNACLRLALLLGEIEREVGNAKLKAIVRRAIRSA